MAQSMRMIWILDLYADDSKDEDAAMEWNLAGSEMAQSRWRAPASLLRTTVQPPHPHLVKISLSQFAQTLPKCTLHCAKLPGNVQKNVKCYKTKKIYVVIGPDVICQKRAKTQRIT